MNKYFLAFFGVEVDHRACLKHHFEWRQCQIFPIYVIERNPCILEFFRTIRKASLEVNAVATLGMLSRLLVVEDCSNSNADNK